MCQFSSLSTRTFCGQTHLGKIIAFSSCPFLKILFLQENLFLVLKVFSVGSQSDFSQSNRVDLFQCFTRGFEYKKHQSDHKYEIMVSIFLLFHHVANPPTLLPPHTHTHSPLRCVTLLPHFVDIGLPGSGAGLDGAGGDGAAGGGHGLRLWELVGTSSL